MGLISRVSSRTYRKTWPSISTEYYQTLISESERPGPSSPRLGSTSQPRRSPDDRPEPPRPPPSPHDQSPAPSEPSFSAQPSDTTLRHESAEASLTRSSRAPDSAPPRPNRSASVSMSDDETSLPRTSSETSSDWRSTKASSSS